VSRSLRWSSLLLLTVVACTSVPPEVGEVVPPVVEGSSCGPLNREVRPLFPVAEPTSGPIVTRRADGVIVTHGAGRVRPRHEREERFMHFEPRYFEKRSFAFTIEDEVATGKSSLKVTYRPIFDWADPGPRTNFRAWKVYGEAGNGPQSYLFANNNVLTTSGVLEQTITITTNARERNRPMRVGDIMQFEFGIFLKGFPADDTFVVGAKSYYSDTFRYQVGVGGLTPETFDTTGLLGPSTQAERLGGDTTVPYVAFADGTAVDPSFAFAQMALNTQAPHQQSWLEGRRLFHTDFGTGAHSERGNPVFTEQVGKLGPLFNVRSCQDCHVHNGRGVVPTTPGARVDTLVWKLEDEGSLGAQLQPQEAPLTLLRTEQKTVTLSDGTRVTLSKPIFDAGRRLKSSARMPRQLIGLGLLEAVDEASLLATQDEADCDGNGISGRVNVIDDPVTGEKRAGRFGWKAEKVSVQHQVADALFLDLGVGTSLVPEGGKVELSDADLERLTTYMRLVGVLPQRGASTPEVVRGAEVFSTIGCANCHLPSMKTGATHPFEELRRQTIRPFTDLLLHDLGADLSDDSGRADAQEWRTPPLWGVGMTRAVTGTVQLLHDGRAASVLEAVLWHGGEATAARQAVIEASAQDRAALLAFVESL
jgi:CxxC motif-containing protein (DUF1111 family)